MIKVKLVLSIASAIAGIVVLHKKISKRGVKVTLADIQKMKEAGRK
jgi:hypothetical protein